MVFHHQHSASIPASQSIFAKQYLAFAHRCQFLLTWITCCRSTMYITAQSGLRAVMIVLGIRNGVRQPIISGLSCGRYAGIDVAQLPTNPQTRDLETLRRRDSDEVSAAPRPSGVIPVPIMTPEARKHHLSSSASSSSRH